MRNYYYTSESVTEGHPDKLADSISDRILDEYLKQDENSRVAIETMVSRNHVMIAGQVTSKAKLNLEEIARKQIQKVGYDNEKIDMDYRTCKINTNITEQSEDIAIGVEEGGAGDQGIMFGYATDETQNYMPYAINMAHNLAKKLTQVRKNREIPYLRPDGKTQVTVEYEENKLKRIETIVISAQHKENVKREELQRDILEKVINEIVPKEKIDERTKIYINPTGRFIIGGPLGDVGLTGRKTVVDTYGGYSHSGGGAFSGKDATKVDRTANYMARHIAKNVVANGYCKKCEIALSYVIGVATPTSIDINTYGTETIPVEEILSKIKQKFKLEPQQIIQYLDLKKPIFSETTNYGHFGKETLPWEKIIKF